MKVDIRIDDSCTEPTVVITAARVTDEVRRAAELLADLGPLDLLVGFQNGMAHVLDPADIQRVYASRGKVYAVTGKGEFVLRIRLYEAEKRLAARHFIRISNSEIVNLREVDRFDLSISGTILVQLRQGEITYVSRRYVPKIREALGM